jgi:hypothetical protein
MQGFTCATATRELHGCTVRAPQHFSWYHLLFAADYAVPTSFDSSAHERHGELKKTAGGEGLAIAVLCPGVVKTGLMETSSDVTHNRSDITPTDGVASDGSNSSVAAVSTFNAMWSQGCVALSLLLHLPRVRCNG